MSTQHWRQETDNDGILWLCIDKADGSANILAAPVLQELNDTIEQLQQAPPTGVILYSAKSNGFIMGADINEFTTIGDVDEAYSLIRQGQRVLERLESLPCPTVAVINGFALGGGLELAMACDYRIAWDIDKSIIGLPEVQLGLHPGFGGTVRSVQLAGVRQAMGLMLTGKPIRPGKARAIGLVDALTNAESWRDSARTLVLTRPARARAPLVDRLMGFGPLRGLVARKLEQQVAGKARKEHYPAPYAMIDLWRQEGASTRTGYDAEARSMAKLMCSDTARNLIRVFFLQNQLKAQGGKAKSDVKRVHVVGAGIMGGDIAAWCALRGLNVTLQDREMKYVQPALDRAAMLFAKRLRDNSKRDDAVKRLRADVDGTGVADADLVIEAIFEDLDAKQSLYRTLQASMRPDAILATNTSSIRLEELRTVLDRPQHFIGLHFFNPVAKLPLVEVIRCVDTESSALDKGFAFVKAIGKFPLGCASSPGFVVNRILAPYMNEAMMLRNEGVALEDIDRAATDFGMPMGPIELVDSVGLDVALGVSRVLGKAFGVAIPDGLEAMVDAGKLGRKSGQGFYRWEDGRAVKQGRGDATVAADLVDRLILPLVNEAMACLNENVVESADLLDAGAIFGTGFAPFRGGPLNYARERGTADVVRALETLSRDVGERFAPRPGWDEFDRKQQE